MKRSLQATHKKSAAQAMVEFALALPILLLVVYGLIETGRLLFIYSSVVTAARNAARYGSASGVVGGGGANYYNDCAGIRAAAKQVGFIQHFSDSDITINYDMGPGSPLTTGCPLTTPITDNLHRILITVSTQYTPMVPLVPFRPFTITSTANRTIITGVFLSVSLPGAPAASGSGGQISITKSANRSNFDTAGQTITYTYTISNSGTGDISGVKLFDDHFLDNSSPPVPVNLYCGVNPIKGGGGTPPQVCTATYTVKQSDVDSKAAIVNNATAQAFDTGGNLLTATVSLSVGFNAVPKLSLAKTGTAPTGAIVAGSEVDYSFVLTNTGNVDLTSPFTISDALIGSNWTCPGSSSTVTIAAATASTAAGTATCTGKYFLKNNDINTGSVSNTATSTAKFGTTTVTSNPSSTTVLTPRIFLTVSNSPTTVSAAGAVITYTYTVKNNTASAESNIVINDNHGANNFACVASLASLATATCPTRTYTVTQADIDSGAIVDSATASGQGNISSNVATPNPGVTVTSSPAITVTKAASPSAPTPAGTSFNPGQVITYTYKMTNSGNKTLTAGTGANAFSITDNKLTPLGSWPAGCTVTSGTFAPGATIISTANCTKTYTLKPADIAAGVLTNIATGTGTYQSNALTSTATVNLPMYNGPQLTITKSTPSTYFTAASQPITYNYGLLNSGTAALTLSTAYTLSDTKLPGVTITCTTTGGTLATTGATLSCGSQTYTTTSTDVSGAVVTNTVSPAAGSTVTSSGTVTIVNGTVSLPLLSCTSSTLHSVSLSPASGTTITWTISNTTLLALPIQSGTITWAGGNLTSVTIGGGSNLLSAPASPGTYTVPNTWTLPTGSSVQMVMTFASAASSPKVTFSFPSSTGCADLSSP